MSVSAVARLLGLGGDTVNDLALPAVRRLAYDDPRHLTGVRYLGGWRPTEGVKVGVVLSFSSRILALL